MKTLEIKIANRLGLHARAAAKFVHLANEFDAAVTVSKGASQVNGKSILGLLTLAAAKGASIKIVAAGTDEDHAIDRLRDLIAGRFGEDE